MAKFFTVPKFPLYEVRLVYPRKKWQLRTESYSDWFNNYETALRVYHRQVHNFDGKPMFIGLYVDTGKSKELQLCVDTR